MAYIDFPGDMLRASADFELNENVVIPRHRKQFYLFEQLHCAMGSNFFEVVFTFRLG